MKISIAQRNRPFSHTPGACCLMPRTCWIVQAFPTRIVCLNRERQNSDERIDISLNLHGPVREFTLLQDLEEGSVLIWGMAKEGRYRLRMKAVQGAIELWVEKAPASGIVCSGKTLHKNDRLSWENPGPFREEAPRERLSLGSHRSQDWESVWRRFDLREIFPALFHLSQWVPMFSFEQQSEMGRLLNQGFEPFLRAAFFSVLCPRLTDDQFQGLIENEPVLPEAKPCGLIVDAGKRIRSLFVEQNKNQISLLGSSEFDAGRMTGVHLDWIGSLDLEWSKHVIKSAIFHAEHDASIQLKLSKYVRSFRLRTSMKEKGCRKSVDDPLDLKAGNNYLIDRFQK